MEKVTVPATLERTLVKAMDEYYGATGVMPNAVLMNLETRRALITEITEHHRYVNTMRFDNGIEAVDFEGVPVFLTKDLKDDRFLLLGAKPWELQPKSQT
jgi:hypothetical protein